MSGPSVRELLRDVEPRRVSLKRAWADLLRALRERKRRTGVEPLLRNRGDIERLLDAPAGEGAEARLELLRTRLGELLLAEDAEARDRAAAEVDRLAAGFLPRTATGPVAVQLGPELPELGRSDLRALLGVDPDELRALDAVEAAVLRRRLHDQVLLGRRLEVGADLPPGVTLPPVPRGRRAAEPRRERPAPWLPHLDEEGRWSLTPEPIARFHAERAAGRPVVDLFCGCGGDAIAFAQAGSRVVAVDRSRERLALARANARALGVAERIRFLADDADAAAARLLRETPEALLYLDPPWGGPDWAREARGWDELVPAGVRAAAERADALLLKAPRTLDPRTLPGAWSLRLWWGEGGVLRLVSAWRGLSGAARPG